MLKGGEGLWSSSASIAGMSRSVFACPTKGGRENVKRRKFCFPAGKMIPWGTPRKTVDEMPNPFPLTVRMTFPRLLLLVVGCLLAGCQQPAGPAVDKPSELLSIFGSEQGIDIVQASTDVHAYRLADGSYYQDDLADYERAGEPVPVPEVDQVTLRDLLLDEGSYELEMAKGCEPVFGVGMSFASGGKAVDILFCFQCDILVVYQDGRAVGDEDFDPARTRLVTLVKKFFPNDNVIEQLH